MHSPSVAGKPSPEDVWFLRLPLALSASTAAVPIVRAATSIPPPSSLYFEEGTEHTPRGVMANRRRLAVADRAHGGVVIMTERLDEVLFRLSAPVAAPSASPGRIAPPRAYCMSLGVHSHYVDSRIGVVTTLWSGWSTGHVSVYSSVSGTLLESMVAHRGAVTDVVSGNGDISLSTYVFTTASDATTLHWDGRTRQVLRSIGMPSGGGLVRSMLVAHGFLCVGCESGAIERWGHTSRPSRTTFVDSSSSLVAMVGEVNGQQLRRCEPLTAHRSAVMSLCATQAPPLSAIWSGCDAGVVRVHCAGEGGGPMGSLALQLGRVLALAPLAGFPDAQSAVVASTSTARVAILYATQQRHAAASSASQHEGAVTAAFGQVAIAFLLVGVPEATSALPAHLPGATAQHPIVSWVACHDEPAKVTRIGAGAAVGHPSERLVVTHQQSGPSMLLGVGASGYVVCLFTRPPVVPQHGAVVQGGLTARLPVMVSPIRPAAADVGLPDGSLPLGEALLVAPAAVERRGEDEATFWKERARAIENRYERFLKESVVGVTHAKSACQELELQVAEKERDRTKMSEVCSDLSEQCRILTEALERQGKKARELEDRVCVACVAAREKEAAAVALEAQLTSANLEANSLRSQMARSQQTVDMFRQRCIDSENGLEALKKAADDGLRGWREAEAALAAAQRRSAELEASELQRRSETDRLTERADLAERSLRDAVDQLRSELVAHEDAAREASDASRDVAHQKAVNEKLLVELAEKSDTIASLQQSLLENGRRHQQLLREGLDAAAMPTRRISPTRPSDSVTASRVKSMASATAAQIDAESRAQQSMLSELELLRRRVVECEIELAAKRRHGGDGAPSAASPPPPSARIPSPPHSQTAAAALASPTRVVTLTPPPLAAMYDRDSRVAAGTQAVLDGARRMMAKRAALAALRSGAPHPSEGRSPPPQSATTTHVASTGAAARVDSVALQLSPLVTGTLGVRPKKETPFVS